mmetsp:Transcript_29640/g.62960  ORF Transcript_29640/g.62960 Transcript_29640/m.62960 type:complete len:867 (-) Transcript_29640:380-2980(-)|eukprot:CAMPEP_0172531504 /NCGR_PEP_ID=MMETSP1067-20121228/4888_1 /TAXON_ID=265564 ORGANISM="Thalassiosira punctigera, Strain Tpunct2005C2" /NCGR_SAMPLE_ID=MMETSP1067 /ASSEMBLY_ACC=CAM_ASM_000444 /LENGTH=866 /DNA_ID=CAMNT_0013315893 /DNA_START=151 /DNA_END=2751 /DNA_ORIENTATION=-
MKYLHGAVKIALLLQRLGEDGAFTSAFPQKSLVIVPSPNNYILHEDKTIDLSSGEGRPLKIRSDVPLSILRYNKDYNYVGYNKPIDEGDGRILVTSDCDTSGTKVVPVVEAIKGQTVVSVELGVSPEEASQMPFLEATSHDATWYESGCSFPVFETPMPVPPRPTPAPIPPKPVSITDGDANVESTACLSKADCDEARQKMGVAKFSAGNFPSKGCFAKNGVAYWGAGGSDDDMSRSDLPGIQTRLWCERMDAPGPKEMGPCSRLECDEKRLEMGMATLSAGNYPTKGCFSKSGAAYWGSGGSAAEMSRADLPGVQERIWCDKGAGKPSVDVDVACLTKEDCDKRRQRNGIESFSVGNYPTKGCFAKKGKSYFSAGSLGDMSEPNLPGAQERIWCTSGGPNINAAQSMSVSNVQQEDAASSAFSLQSLAWSSFFCGVFSKADTVPPPQSSTLDTCTYNVEILLNSCSSYGETADIEVKAPRARVIDSDMQNFKEEAFDITDYKYTGTLAFPADRAVVVDISDGERYASVRPSDEDRCYDVVCGRPFVDSTGNNLLASPFSSVHCGRVSSWSRGGAVALESADLTTNAMTTQVPATNNTLGRIELGEEWTKSALGEHASVASFAAFSIALMSNQAPSHLVEDSLKAALDEVRHARVSFAIASKLIGREVGPGPLPPSTHEFGRDLTALALSVAREGCVDETLSALAAAAEAELIDEALEGEVEEGTKYSGIKSEILVWIRDELRGIAADEGNHSALAWRTLDWVCAVDEDACDAAKRSVMNEDQLEAAFQLRFSRSFGGSPELLEQMRAAWESICRNQRVIYSDAASNDIEGSACVGGDTEEGNVNPNASTLSLLVEIILRGNMSRV